MLTFCSSINERLQTLHITRVDHAHKSSVDPAPCFNAIKSAYYHFKLHVVVFVLVLDFPIVRGNSNSLDSVLDKCSRNLSFRFSYIGLAKEKLAVQI